MVQSLTNARRVLPQQLSRSTALHGPLLLFCIHTFPNPHSFSSCITHTISQLLDHSSFKMSFSFITGIQQTSLIICGSVSTAYQESQIHIDYAPFTSGTWTAWSHLEESSHKFLFGLRWDDATPLACTNGSLAITSPAVCQYSNHGGACNQPGKYCKQQMLLTISNTFPSTNSGQIQLEGTFKNTSPTTFSATLVLHNPSMSTNLSSLNSARKLLYTSSRGCFLQTSKHH